jgi:hypothetical protein
MDTSDYVYSLDPHNLYLLKLVNLHGYIWTNQFCLDTILLEVCLESLAT